MGVILLMFGVGLHFSLKDLLAVRSIAIPGALGQSTAATIACTGLRGCARLVMANGIDTWGCRLGCQHVRLAPHAHRSTAASTRLKDHAAVGWLIVEDIITVLVLVRYPPLAATGGSWNKPLANGRKRGPEACRAHRDP